MGTVTFAWNIWKWRQESPRIVGTIEAIRSHWTENEYAGIRLTLRNRGGKRTTVEEISLCQRPRWSEWGWHCILFRLRGEVTWKHDVGFSNSKTAKLPVVLDVNEVWKGFIPLELNNPDDDEERQQLERNRDALKILKSRKLRYSIQCSHTHRRLRGWVGNEDEGIKE